MKLIESILTQESPAYTAGRKDHGQRADAPFGGL